MEKAFSGQKKYFINRKSIFHGVLTNQQRRDDAACSAVLNGTAYDAEEDRLFVTGKLWPKVFEIRL